MTTQRYYAIQGRKDIEAARRAFVLENMASNKACVHAVEAAGGDGQGKIVEDFRRRYLAYRESWRGNPERAVAEKLYGDTFKASGMTPLSVDMEVAAVCDLACPFCFRQWIATPDKIMPFELCTRLLDQCAELGAPSVKLNWRGEPLLNPRLPEIVNHAKRMGILDVIMNTNAVTLDEAKARALIEAGLDQMIYSFDGGSKETYERMRPGRFKDNPFEPVMANIRRFAEIRREMGAVLPRTQIQMILTGDTFDEQDSFFEMFEDCVDDVSVKAYTERGGRLPDLDAETRAGLEDVMKANGLSDTAAYWRDFEGNLYIERGRLPCEQPFQRLMVAYDGRVSMCCYDWGGEHPVGYADEAAIAAGQDAFEEVMESIDSGKAGFSEFMSGARMPAPFVSPAPKVETLAEIWHGAMINDVRKSHLEDRLEEVAVCTRCPFKETYDWLDVASDGHEADTTRKAVS